MIKPHIGNHPCRSAAKYTKKSQFSEIDDSTTIWRYMDFDKFSFLLEQKALYFSRVREFLDKYEGTYAMDNLKEVFSPSAPLQLKKFERKQKLIQKATTDIMRLIYVNCFTIRASESVEMWRYYTRSNESVVIKSSFGKLKNSFIKLPGDSQKFPEVYIGKVNYIDYKRDYVHERSILSPFIYKQKKFEFEQELRLLTTYPQLDRAVNEGAYDLVEKNGCKSVAELLNLDELPDYPAIFVSVDLATLIDQVVIHSQATEDFITEVRDCCKRSGLDVDVVSSSLELSV